MDAKDLLLQAGVVVTFVLGVVNLYFTLKTSKRTSFINTVTAERVKWIGKVRENVAKLCAMIEEGVVDANRRASADYQRSVEQLKNELRLQLNPRDPEDQDIERQLARLPSWTTSLGPEETRAALKTLVTSTQAMLKREWDKVKEEAQHGDLRAPASRRRQ